MKNFLKPLDQIARLLRLPNLLILALIQYSVRYGIFYPIFESRGLELQMSSLDFALLVISTLLIAAGGYVINDYYDVRIDQVNRPEKIVVGNFITPKRANLLHNVLTLLACALGIYVSYRVGSLKLGFIHIMTALVLFYYSLKYKRMPFAGNIAIALLAALSIVIVYLFEFFALKQQPLAFGEMLGYFSTINILVFGYAFFAFLVTLIREMVKDIEDIEGDKTDGCRTLPIVYGIPKMRMILIGLSAVYGAFIAYATFNMFYWQYDAAGWYFAVVVCLLWLYFMFHLVKATSKKEYHFVSTLLKINMVAGILSMQLLYASF
jgi:4-hydroxybenzoate polyprenyltransferase